MTADQLNLQPLFREDRKREANGKSPNGEYGQCHNEQMLSLPYRTTAIRADAPSPLSVALTQTAEHSRTNTARLGNDNASTGALVCVSPQYM